MQCLSRLQHIVHGYLLRSVSNRRRWVFVRVLVDIVVGSATSITAEAIRSIEDIHALSLPSTKRAPLIQFSKESVVLAATTIYEAQITESMVQGGLARKKLLAKAAADFINAVGDSAASPADHVHPKLLAFANAQGGAAATKTGRKSGSFASASASAAQ